MQLNREDRLERIRKFLEEWQVVGRKKYNKLRCDQFNKEAKRICVRYVPFNKILLHYPLATPTYVAAYVLQTRSGRAKSTMYFHTIYKFWYILLSASTRTKTITVRVIDLKKKIKREKKWIFVILFIRCHLIRFFYFRVNQVIVTW